MTPETECSIRSLLPAELNDLDGEIERHLRENPEFAAGTPLGFGLSVVRDRAIESVRDALDIDLFTTLARGWSGALELRAIGIESRKEPEKEKTVYLGKHSLVSTLHPVVEVQCMGTRAFRLRFTLKLEAAFRIVGLSIRNGFIVSVGKAECDVELSLNFGEHRLHPKLKTAPAVLTSAHALAPPGWEIA